MKLLLLLLLFASPLIAQLPERGPLTDISTKRKVYIAADAAHRKFVEKAAKKELVIVSKPSDAEFFLEYKVLSTDRGGSLQLSTETGQLEAYYLKEGQKVVVWSESADDSGISRPPAEKLTKQFLKERKRHASSLPPISILHTS